MEKNATLHRDADGSSLCATIAGEMGDVTSGGGVKGAGEKCRNSEAPVSSLVSVSCYNSTDSVPAPLGVSALPKSELPAGSGDEKEESPWSGSGDQISNGMGHDSVLAAGDSEGGASKLVNNTPDGPASPPAAHGADAPAQVSPGAPSEEPKLAKPTHLCPAANKQELSEALPSGSDPEPSPGGESRSIDSLESFSNLNSCPSSDLNSEGLEERGLALALHSEYGADGTKPGLAKDRAAGQSIYHIKWIKWREENTPIITQNENGPCPLLAIMNVLLLAWKVKPQETSSMENLMTSYYTNGLIY